MIQEAKQRYKLEVLQAPSKHQFIYLLGEQHRKNDYETLELGHEIIDAFKYRALDIQPQQSELLSKVVRQWPVNRLSASMLALQYDEIPDPKNPGATVSATNIMIDTADSMVAVVARDRTQAANMGVAPVIVVWGLSYAIRLLSDSSLSSLFSKSLAATGFVLVLNAILALADLQLGDKLRGHQHQSWFKYLLPNFYGLVTVRDEAMALEIDTILYQRPDVHSLLVVVGAAHLPGLVQNLSRDYGFRRMEVPEVEGEQTMWSNPSTGR